MQSSQYLNIDPSPVNILATQEVKAQTQVNSNLPSHRHNSMDDNDEPTLRTSHDRKVIYMSPSIKNKGI